MSTMKNAIQLAVICALLLFSTAKAAPIDDAEQALQARLRRRGHTEITILRREEHV
jgi:hypothetical protein